MARGLRTWIVLAAVPLGAVGCANLMTERVITTFNDSLKDKKLDDLKKSTSETFGDKALRLPESINDFKVLNLPTGKTTVLKVKQISANEQVVQVEIGDKKHKQPVEYRLKRKGQEWVIDDIIISRGEGDHKLTAAVTEQMDLLNLLREFVAAGRGGKEDCLKVCTADFQETFEGLPPAWRKQIIVKLLPDDMAKSFHPEARIQKDHAGLILERGKAKLLLECRNVNGRWKVFDAAVESSNAKEQVRSARKEVALLKRAAEFITAYAANDTAKLKETSVASFYNNCLSAADVRAIPIPAEKLLDTKFEIRPHKDQSESDPKERAEVVFETADSTYVLSVVAALSPDGAPNLLASAPEVEEVTIYDNAGHDVKRISAMFLSQAVVQIYAESLAHRDRRALQQQSSLDFNRRVWDRMDEEIMKVIPMPEVESAAPQILSTIFNGPMTEVTVLQGERALTYVLSSNRGELVVDDLLVPVIDRPISFKTNLEALSTVYDFALGIHKQDLARLKSTSAESLNRIVWGQVRDIPDIGFEIVELLTQPMNGMRMESDQTIVKLGDQQHGAEVTIAQDHGHPVVYDVKLIKGPSAKQQANLLQAMRHVIAEKMLADPPRVMQASNEEVEEDEKPAAPPRRRHKVSRIPDEVAE